MIRLQHALLHLWQKRETEGVSCAEDDVIDVLHFRAVLEGDVSRFVAEVDYLLLDGDVRVCEGLPAEMGNGIAA